MKDEYSEDFEISEDIDGQSFAGPDKDLCGDKGSYSGRWEESKSSPDLYRKSVKGSTWVFGLRLCTQALSFVRYIVLANLLDIGDFGILGIGLLLIHILERFSSTGFRYALIQKKDDVKDYLNTAWSFGLVRAVFLYILLFFSARYMVEWRVEPAKQAVALDVIRVLGFVLILEAFKNIGLVYFSKDLKFNKYFSIQVISNLSGIIFSIVIAYVYRSVWALVAGKVSSAVVGVFLSYSMQSFRPRLDFHLGRARELWSFGKWVLFSTIQNFILTEGDDLFVMSYLGVDPLAYYQMAYRYSNIPATQITHMVNRVALPAYSQIQDEVERLKKAYLKTMRMLSSVTFPVSGLILISAPGFVSNLLKPGWEPIILPMQILSIYGCTRAAGASRSPVLMALNKHKFGVYISMIRIFIMLLLIWPFAKYWGITGVSVLIVLLPIASRPVSDYILLKLLSMKFGEYISSQILPLLSFAGAVSATITVDHYFINSRLSMLRFAGILGVYSISYLAFFVLLEYFTGWRNIRSLFEVSGAFGRKLEQP